MAQDARSLLTARLGGQDKNPSSRVLQVSKQTSSSERLTLPTFGLSPRDALALLSVVTGTSLPPSPFPAPIQKSFLLLRRGQDKTLFRALILRPPERSEARVSSPGRQPPSRPGRPRQPGQISHPPEATPTSDGASSPGMERGGPRTRPAPRIRHFRFSHGGVLGRGPSGGSSGRSRETTPGPRQCHAGAHRGPAGTSEHCASRFTEERPPGERQFPSCEQ